MLQMLDWAPHLQMCVWRIYPRGIVGFDLCLLHIIGSFGIFSAQLWMKNVIKPYKKIRKQKIIKIQS